MSLLSQHFEVMVKRKGLVCARKDEQKRQRSYHRIAAMEPALLRWKRLRSVVKASVALLRV